MSSYTSEDILMIENARALDLLFEQSAEIAKLKAQINDLKMLAEKTDWSSTIMAMDAEYSRQQELNL
jgi:hypothetical protein